jgi:hypothetical protein
MFASFLMKLLKSIRSKLNITIIFTSYVYVNSFLGNLDWSIEKNENFFTFQGNGGS